MKLHPNKCGTVLPRLIVIAIFLGLPSACIPQESCTHQPCTRTEIRGRFAEGKISRSIYIPKTNSPYSDVNSSFYYVDNGSETRLVTIFTSSKADARIAVMITSSFLEPLDMITTRHPQKVGVDWANESSASTWELIPSKLADDRLRGTTSQTFIVWMKGELWFHFYSALPLDETLALINALEEIKP